MAVNFHNKVAVITGAGGGLGRSYALLLASLGGKIVVNDLDTGVKGEVTHHAGKRAADKVVDEIRSKGGVAVANYDSVEFGNKIIDTAIKNFGRVDILINNAGVLKDCSFQKMQEKDWDAIMLVHLKGAFSCAKAAWKHMQQQKYGRIINTASAAGLYGNFGQVNYSTAKIGLVGFTKSLAMEGLKYNIKVNSIAPLAGTRMTETVMPKEIVDALKPEYVAPVVAYLASDKCNDTGEVIEVGAGWVAKVRWQRTAGKLFPLPFTVDNVKNEWNKVSDFSNPSYPNSLQDSIMMVTQRLSDFNESSKEVENFEKGEKKEIVLAEKEEVKNITSKSDKIFYLMQIYLKNLETKQANELVQKVNSIFHFDVSPSKGAPPSSSWTIDLKNAAGKVNSGKHGDANAEFSMTENDFVSVCLGKLNPQTAFLQGKMKIKGNMKAATKFTPNLFPKITEEILKFSPDEAVKLYLKDIGVPSTPSSTVSTSSSSFSSSNSNKKWSDNAMKLRASNILSIIEDFLSSTKGKSVSNEIGHTYQFDIIPKKGETPISFVFDLKSSPGKLSEGKSKCDATFTMLDEDFVKLVTGKLNPQSAFMQGKMKIKGNMKAAMKFKPELFPKLSSL